MPGGTQADILAKAQQRLKAAQAYAEQCGRAQVGTPDGDNLHNARKAAEAAQREVNAAQASYDNEMSRLK